MQKPQRHDIVIEYCPGCQWMLRASYWASEILQTFQADHVLRQVSLRPSAVTGTFRIWVESGNDEQDCGVVWDRKADGGFPEVKLLKQRIRAIIAPEKSLGHSEGSGV